MEGKVKHWSSFSICINGKTILGIDEAFYKLNVDVLNAKLKKAEAIEDYEVCIEIRNEINNYKKF